MISTSNQNNNNNNNNVVITSLFFPSGIQYLKSYIKRILVHSHDQTIPQV